MKRIALFVATNLAVLVVLGAVMTLIEPWLVANGYNVNQVQILVFAVLFGFGGSFISLLLSKRIALWSTKAQIIDNPGSEAERWLVQRVRQHAEGAGIGMPDVAIYPAPEMNAFATGASKNNALVAVSTGLLESMRREEIDAVLGHEVAHVANGDMVTMALLQGVLNTFVLLVSRLIGQLVDRVVFKTESGYGIGYWVVTIIAQIVLGILASMIVMAFSRWREFRADEGGARLAGRENMIAALKRLGAVPNESTLPDSVEAFGISGNKMAGWRKLMMSHPPIAERIEALQNLEPGVRDAA